MNINNIKVTLINKPDSKIKAVASFVVDNTIVVHDVRIIGYTKEEIMALPDFMHDLLQNPVVNNYHILVSMPSKKTENGNIVNVVNPFNKEATNYINTEIISAYQKLIEKNLSNNT